MPIKNIKNRLIDTRKITNLSDLIRENAEMYGDTPCYVYNVKKITKEYSYRELYENTLKMGAAFEKLGLLGKPIAVIGEADPAYMTTYYTVVNGNGVIIPLDKEISDDEIVNFLILSEAAAVVYTSGQNGRIAALADRLPDVQRFIPVDSKNETVTCDRILPYTELLQIGQECIAAGESHYSEIEIDTEKCCAIIFTSGTTGTSKGVMLCQKNLCTNATSAANAIDFIEKGSRLVSVLPMNHTYEVTCSHMTAQFFGATTFLNDSLKYVLRNFQKFKPQVLVLVPLFVETMHKKIWAEIRAKGKEKLVRRIIKLSNALLKVGIDLRKKFFAQILGALGGELQGIVCGGAPLNPQLIQDFRDFGIDILEGYGITECSPLLAVNTKGKERMRSVGPAVLNVKVRIDKENPRDETGEIVALGDNVMLGYYRNKEATDDVFTEDGWFRTGDIGYMDEDGYIYITGRKKNVIILSNGKNIFPEEIEEYLGRVEIIAESVIVGRPLPDGDEAVITALVFPDYELLKGLSDEEVYNKISEEIDTINRELPQYKQVRQIIIRKTEFEKTTSRKIKRHKL